MSARDGGAAFPTQEFIQGFDEKPPVMAGRFSDGMTLRDYFAAAAIGRAVEVAAQFVMDEPGFRPGERRLSEVRDRAATLAYSIADAMLAERVR